MPATPGKAPAVGSRLLIMVHLPSGTAEACVLAWVWRHAAREPRSAILARCLASAVNVSLRPMQIDNQRSL